MRKESATVQKCKRQMATLGFDSQLAYHRVKLILKIYRMWCGSSVSGWKNCMSMPGSWVLKTLIPGLSIYRVSPRIWICRSLRNGSAA